MTISGCGLVQTSNICKHSMISSRLPIRTVESAPNNKHGEPERRGLSRPFHLALPMELVNFVVDYSSVSFVHQWIDFLHDLRG